MELQLKELPHYWVSLICSFAIWNSDISRWRLLISCQSKYFQE